MREEDREPRAGDARTRASEGRDARRPGGLIERLRSLFGMGAPTIRDDIEDALEETGSAGVFSAQERAMLRNVLDLHEVRIDDIMVPRADVIAVGVDVTLAEVLDTFRTAGHSRLPVHGDTLDDPRGMVHIRDFVDVLAGAIDAGRSGSSSGGQPSAVPATAGDLGSASPSSRLDVTVADSGIIRPVLFVPPSMRAIDLLVKMQTSRTHMALVIDEYGGTDGLVSIEDIVEVIVGDIEDEHDEDEQPLVALAEDGALVADGRASLEEVSAALGTDLATEDDADEIDTIGGFVTALAGRVPDRGEVVSEDDGFEFEILDADPRRVKRVRIRRRDAAADASPARGASDPAPVDPAVSPRSG